MVWSQEVLNPLWTGHQDVSLVGPVLIAPMHKTVSCVSGFFVD